AISLVAGVGAKALTGASMPSDAATNTHGEDQGNRINHDSRVSRTIHRGRNRAPSGSVPFWNRTRAESQREAGGSATFRGRTIPSVSRLGARVPDVSSRHR